MIVGLKKSNSEIKKELPETDSSYFKNIKYIGSNPELEKAITISLKTVGNFRYQHGE